MGFQGLVSEMSIEALEGTEKRSYLYGKRSQERRC